jgi:rSAM/selenodomain-associated transferase 1
LTCDKYVFLTKELEDNFWSGFKPEIQKGESLGDKMKHAFSLLFDKGYENVLIIGTDCPGITTQMVNDGYEKLKSHDVVIGPAEDGGYYLLGMNAMHNSLFEDIRWSSAVVRHQTIEKAEKLNLTYTLLPILNDVDEEKDVPPAWL